ncbi:MAG: choice-of-anchor L domain-containing protein [Flavobacteriales bacterium]|nr:choice-of-anchor L domain-containing protein [Flavobacteriales bacterium]
MKESIHFDDMNIDQMSLQDMHHDLFLTKVNFMIRNTTITFLLLFGINASSQLIINSNQNAGNYIQDMLLGSEIQISNLSVNGGSAELPITSIGEFECINCAIGIDEGIILSTGIATSAMGPNNVTNTSASLSLSTIDADMDDLASEAQLSNINDLTVIEFDFVAYSNNLDLEIVWASEEYDSYVSSNYNDFFGAFLSGPGIAGPYSNDAVNLALVPGTSLPIGVRNINNGYGNIGPCAHCEYYNQYENDEYLSTHPFDPHFSNIHFSQFDGWTVPIHLQYELQCGETYHLKLAIADATDSSFDSGLFIRSRINSNGTAVLVSSQFGDSSESDDVFFESCNSGSITFQRPASTDINVDFLVDLTYSGSASSGSDYVSLPSQIVIPAGETQFILPIEIIADDVIENLETLILQLSYLGPCPSGIATSMYTMNISDSPPSLGIVQQSPLVCPDLENFIHPNIVGGSGNFTYAWDNGSHEDTLFYTTSNDTTYTFTLTDNCNGNSVSYNYEVSVFNAPPITLDIVDTDNSLPIVCLESTILDVYTFGGISPFFYTYASHNANYTTTFLNELWTSAYNVGMNVVTVTDYCNNFSADSIFVEVEIDEITINLPDTITYHCGEHMTTIVNFEYSGNTENSIYFEWRLDNNLLSTENDTCEYVGYDVNNLQVSVYGDCILSDFDEATLVMLPYDPSNSDPAYESLCLTYNGCIDSLACNYNENAIFEDASCVYSVPSSIITGSITPGNSNLFTYTYDAVSNSDFIWTITNGEIVNGQGTSGVEVQWYDAGQGSITVQEILNSCSSEPVTLNVEVLSIGENNDLHIRIYPVPAHEYFNIQLSSEWVGSNYSITDETGRLLQQGLFNSRNNVIPTTNMAQGNYQLTLISTRGETMHKRFMVMN